jgi:hypothetical protein
VLQKHYPPRQKPFSEQKFGQIVAIAQKLLIEAGQLSVPVYVTHPDYPVEHLYI